MGQQDTLGPSEKLISRAGNLEGQRVWVPPDSPLRNKGSGSHPQKGCGPLAKRRPALRGDACRPQTSRSVCSGRRPPTTLGLRSGGGSPSCSKNVAHYVIHTRKATSVKCKVPPSSRACAPRQPPFSAGVPPADALVAGTNVWAHGGVRGHTALCDPGRDAGRASFCTSLTAPLSGREHRTPSFFQWLRGTRRCRLTGLAAPQLINLQVDCTSSCGGERPYPRGLARLSAVWDTCVRGVGSLGQRLSRLFLTAAAGGPSAELTGTLPAPEPGQVCSLHSPNTGYCQPFFISDEMKVKDSILF